jgi:hypothetical protein
MPNTAPKLNGWQRLGIVLSIFWMIAVGIECWVELGENLPPDGGWVTDMVRLTDTVSPVRPPDGPAPVEYPRTEQVVNIARLLVALIAAPIALWPIGFSIVWVRRGFQGRSASKGNRAVHTSNLTYGVLVIAVFVALAAKIRATMAPLLNDNQLNKGRLDSGHSAWKFLPFYYWRQRPTWLTLTGQRFQSP